MPEKVVKDKVLCYVVRDGWLLVFRHTDYSYEEVGIQVPAGSVRPGETPEDAALREAREETGLTDFKIVRKLGETEYNISPYRFEIQRRHVFHLELTEPTPQRWASQEDHDGESQPTPTHFECFWVQAHPVILPGPGSLWCSAHDLDRWLGHLHQEWATQGFHAPPFDAEIGYLHSDHSPYRYGVGLYTNTTAPENTVVFRYGHEHGFSAATRLADNGLRIVCLSNNADIHADHVDSRIVQHLTHGGTLDEIHTCLGAFATTAGTAPKRAATRSPFLRPTPSPTTTSTRSRSISSAPQHCTTSSPAVKIPKRHTVAAVPSG